MWNGYCGNLIRRANRNMLIAIVCIAAAGALFLYYQRQYLTQFFHGPNSVDATKVVQSPIENQFVRIHVERALDTGIQHTTTENGGPARVDSQYFVTMAGGKLLVLRLPHGGHPEEISDLTFEGRVRPIPADLGKHLDNNLRADLPPVATYYIDGQDYRDLGIVSLVVGIPILLLWSWMLWRYMQASGDFSRHPFAKRIAKYGQLEMLVQEIDAEMAGAHSTYSVRTNTVEVSQNWFLTHSLFAGEAIRLNHLTWAYQYLLKRKLYYFITIKTTYFVHAYDDLGNKTQIQLSKERVAEILQELAVRVPHALFGYNKSLQKLWKASKKDPSRFLQEARTLAGQTELAPQRTGTLPLH